MGQQIIHAHTQEMVRVHQAGGIDNTVAVSIRVVRQCDIKLIAGIQQVGHGRGAGAVHTDTTIVIRWHKCKGRVEGFVYHRQVQAFILSQRLPDWQGRAAHRIGAQLQCAVANSIQIDHLFKLRDVFSNVIVFCCSGDSGWQLNGFHLSAIRSQIFIGAGFNPTGHVTIGRAAIRRVVLNTAVFRWVV